MNAPALHSCYVNPVPTLTAKKSELVQSLLSNSNELLQAVNLLSEGHVNVVFPQQIAKNIAHMKSTFEAHGVTPKMFVSHKPTKSNALLKQVEAEGMCLDVSSKGELLSALKNGFSGNRISCTGVKNNEYILLSIQHGCLHSVDNISELRRYVTLKNKVTAEKRNVLLRIDSAHAPYGGKVTRFGMQLSDLEEAYALFKANPTINLEGFHMHSAEADGALKGEEISFMIELIQQAYEKGFKPNIVDVGGAFFKGSHDDICECENFMDKLAKNIIKGAETHTWRGFTYGILAGNNNGVSGRANIAHTLKIGSYEKDIEEALNFKTLADRTNAQTLTECGFDLVIEPGSSIFDECGVTLFKVIETKFNSIGEHITIVSGNSVNLSPMAVDYLADPVLLSESSENESGTFSTYVAGNLCAEFDIMIKRKVVLSAEPKEGDYLCFINTAAYTADFHDSAVHQHPTGQKMVALQTGNKWKFFSEDKFNPYLI